MRTIPPLVAMIGIASVLGASDVRTLESPFVQVADQGVDGFTTISFDATACALLREGHADGQVLELEGFPLPGGRRIDLVLRPESVMSAGATAVVVTEQGEHDLAPSIALYSGHVPGATSSVFLGISADMLHGFITLDDELFILSSGIDNTGVATVGTPSSLGTNSGAGEWCHAITGALSSHDTGSVGAGVQFGSTPHVKVGDIFIEADNEFRAIFSSDQAAIDYATLLFATNAFIYRRDIGMSMNIPSGYLRLWTTTPPWGIINDFNDIQDVQAYWDSPANPNQFLPRAAVHVLTNPVFGGVGYLPGGCSLGFDIAISSVYGFFPTPLVHHDVDNWDLLVTMHENGHLFGSPHTFDYTPPIACNDGSGPDMGTLMSYCHQNPGGVDNIGIRFHKRVQDEMRNFLDSTSGCLQIVPFQLGDYDFDGTLEASDLAALDSFLVQGFESSGAFETFDMDQDGDVDDCDRRTLAALVPASAPSVRIYGCDVNPFDSLIVQSGAASIGTLLLLGIDNPTGSQPAGSIVFLGVSNAADAAYPSGTLVPNTGMSGGSGELLINLSPPFPVVPVFTGGAWGGAGTFSTVFIQIPNDAGLVGSSVFGQGLILDPTVAAGVQFGLTNAVVLDIGF